MFSVMLYMTKKTFFENFKVTWFLFFQRMSRKYKTWRLLRTKTLPNLKSVIIYSSSQSRKSTLFSEIGTNHEYKRSLLISFFSVDKKVPQFIRCEVAWEIWLPNLFFQIFHFDATALKFFNILISLPFDLKITLKNHQLNPDFFYFCYLLAPENNIMKRKKNRILD